MTRRDYILIAAALRLSRPPGYGELEAHAQFQRDCASVANALERDPCFDRIRFLRNCGAIAGIPDSEVLR